MLTTGRERLILGPVWDQKQERSRECKRFQDNAPNLSPRQIGFANHRDHNMPSGKSVRHVIKAVKLYRFIGAFRDSGSFAY